MVNPTNPHKETDAVFLLDCYCFVSVVSNNLILFLPSSKLKTKMYIALQSLELDLTKMMHMFR